MGKHINKYVNSYRVKWVVGKFWASLKSKKQMSGCDCSNKIIYQSLPNSSCSINQSINITTNNTYIHTNLINYLLFIHLLLLLLLLLCLNYLNILSYLSILCLQLIMSNVSIPSPWSSMWTFIVSQFLWRVWWWYVVLRSE